MTVVLDTNVLVDHLRGNDQATRALERLRAADDAIAASVLTRSELRAGVRPRDRGKLEALFAEVAWIAVDEAIADEAGLLASRYRRSHAAIEIVDYVVAATVGILRARLWTLNLKHFPMFPELEPPY